MENNYTSLELSKLLYEAGFKEISEKTWFDAGSYTELINECIMFIRWDDYGIENLFKAYDIMNDLCVRYQEEVWGSRDKINFHTRMVLQILQQATEEDAENYILEHSILFNKE